MSNWQIAPNYYWKKKLAKRRYRNKRGQRNNRALMKAALPRGIQIKVHHFKQNFYPGTGSVSVSGMTYPSAGNLIGPTTGGGTDGAFSIFFQMSDLPQVASFSALFDEYKVNYVKYKFTPAVEQYAETNVITDTATPFQMQYLNTVLDYDDATNLTSINQAMEYESFKSTRAGHITVRSGVPSLSNEVYRTGGGTIGYARKSKQWCDMAYTDIPFYLLKGYIDHYAAAQLQMRWKVIGTAYISFRQVR